MQMGGMLEDMELRIRNTIEGVYIQKTREVITFTTCHLDISFLIS